MSTVPTTIGRKRWVAAGTLPSVKVGAARRVHLGDVTEFGNRRGSDVNVTGPESKVTGSGIEGAEGRSPGEAPASMPPGLAS